MCLSLSRSHRLQGWRRIKQNYDARNFYTAAGTSPIAIIDSLNSDCAQTKCEKSNCITVLRLHWFSECHSPLSWHHSCEYRILWLSFATEMIVQLSICSLQTLLLSRPTTDKWNWDDVFTKPNLLRTWRAISYVCLCIQLYVVYI